MAKESNLKDRLPSLALILSAVSVVLIILSFIVYQPFAYEPLGTFLQLSVGGLSFIVGIAGFVLGMISLIRWREINMPQRVFSIIAVSPPVLCIVGLIVYMFVYIITGSDM
jgi:hypothetical protein